MKRLICVLSLFVFLTGYSFTASSSNKYENNVPLQKQPLLVAGFGDFINQIQKDASEVLDSTTRRVMGEPSQPKEHIPPPKKEQRNTAPRTTNYPRTTTHQSYGLNRQENKEIQQFLIDAGYNPGPADGMPGNKTRKAIRSYQLNNHLRVDGIPSVALLDHMRNRTAQTTNDNIPNSNKHVVSDIDKPVANETNVNSTSKQKPVDRPVISINWYKPYHLLVAHPDGKVWKAYCSKNCQDGNLRNPSEWSSKTLSTKRLPDIVSVSQNNVNA
ncbi:MAG: peptidoglycan-binding protein [gamma proteobacterium symbiont of Bathyaustriella thionipta]|nr:peptidoglycan-binding protein [gamma proteobacterium symbiont of Bathyaustriella thionipta]MCU7950961.1 peptidoglycan-binding protein [gamma proteobacterium symbiont of Bathyaustriella thionipta]MCU7954539.1 peptidoglycan-binding protein [gamma proteobacterium symbiont of Bathyaustriella thionipta]MCU7957446.1 peptidoglycan-binding protein [gamma proteobacterium symbiont of Bathyaustriella thionipta]MCU7968448.1 peptidoglycan-binding protein [gamma proteobacterium symbiont of Bathyaustriella